MDPHMITGNCGSAKLAQFGANTSPETKRNETELESQTNFIQGFKQAVV
jgi:hypothetical protein